jgi:hypothetical protein
MLKPNTCRHYTGIGAGTCTAGIVYHDFLGAGQALPCYPQGPNDARPQGRCVRCDLPRAEECAADEARVREAMRAYFAAYAARQDRGECGTCGMPMTAKVQVGRCIYVEPCGCRVGQGRLMQDGKPLARLEIAPTKNESESAYESAHD